jgi:hypothetical protein
VLNRLTDRNEKLQTLLGREMVIIAILGDGDTLYLTRCITRSPFGLTGRFEPLSRLPKGRLCNVEDPEAGC